MSYDFHLFLPQPGVDPLVTAQAEPDPESEEINPGPPVPAKETRKRAIADALMKADPVLQISAFRFEEIAQFQNTSVDEAKRQFRHIELNGPEDGPGIQITLFDDSAALTVPYWHKDAKAKSVFRQIWDYLKIIQEVSGYAIYDPQRECLVALGSDLEETTLGYAEIVKRVFG